jgi:hypothetical protein
LAVIVDGKKRRCRQQQQAGHQQRQRPGVAQGKQQQAQPGVVKQYFPVEQQQVRMDQAQRQQPE